MLDGVLNNSTIPLLEKLAAFGARRQEVLAGNIANIDTPFYKMRDLPVAEFDQALKAAVQGRRAPAAEESALETQQTLSNVNDFFPARLFRAREAPSPDLTFHDANNRSIEQQVTEMTKNSLTQQFAVELLTAQLNMLQMVVSERA